MPIASPAASVALEGFELRVLHLPLVSPFTTSFGTETVREVIVEGVRTADIAAPGEAANTFEVAAAIAASVTRR